MDVTCHVTFVAVFRQCGLGSSSHWSAPRRSGFPLSCFDLTLLLAASHVRFAQVLQRTQFHALNDFFSKSPQRVEATEATVSLFCYYVRRKGFYRYVHLVDDFTV